MIALLRTRRWIGFTTLVAVSIVAFGLLSLWQFHRAEEKRLERTGLQSALASAPAALESVVDLRGSEPGSAAGIEWSPVVVTGRYDDRSQVVVRKRPLDTRNGFWVMTPLVLDSGPTVWVNRGWIPTSGDALATPAIPAPPTGTVEVSGWLRWFEDVPGDANEGLPPGQVAAPAVATLPDVGATTAGYLQLGASDPEQTEVVTLPLPTVDEGRNISYAIQWLLFAAVAIAGWFYFLRREAAEDAQQAIPVVGTGTEEPWT